MQRLLSIAGLLLFPAFPAMAQETPQVEGFFAYSYQRAQVAASTAVNLNGWNGSLQANLSNWLGFVGDLSGHYGTFSGQGVNMYSFLFGPQVTYRKAERPTPFARVLVGASRASSGFAPAGSSESSVAWGLGGGVDVKLTDRISARVVQADYIQTRFRGRKQNNARLSFGIVLRIGQR